MLAQKISPKSAPGREESCKKGHTIFKEGCGSCQRLKKGWYGYLATMGFEDIEKDDRNLDGKTVLHLAQRSEFRNQVQYEAKVNYYTWAYQKIEDGNLKASFSEREQMIWKCHAEGMARRKIAPLVNYEHSYISRKIKKIEDFLRVHSVSSGSLQLDIFFWAQATNT